MKTRRPVRSLVSSTLWVTRLDNFGSAWSDTSMMSMDEYRILEEAGCAFLPAADVRLDERKKRKKKKKKIRYSKKVVSLQHKNRLN